MKMKQRQDGQHKDHESWKDFWSAIASGLARRSTSPSTSTSAEHFTYLPSTTTSMSAGTVLVTVPETTIFVPTTIVATTFITVPETTATLSSTSALASGSFSPSSNSTSSTSSRLNTTTSSAAVASAFPATSVVSSISTTTTSSWKITSTPTGSLIGAQDRSESQRHAIIGGLAGSIAGLFFVGVLVCLALRIRRKRNEPAEMDESSDEKGFRPAMIRKWTQLTGGGIASPKQMDLEKRSTSPVSIDEDHRIIRLNTRHWPRPFVAGIGEGYRESQPQRTLRVVNPDQSRPETPSPSSDAALSHFRKQRPSLAGLVLGVSKYSPEAKLQQNLAAQKPIPTITVIDPNLSRECIATYDRTPSFRSYSSVASTLPVVTQRPPDDPFTTSPLRPSPLRLNAGANPQKHHESPNVKPTKPNISATQSAGGKSWAQFSTHLLHPFTKQTEAIQNVRGLSHFSISSNGTRSSRRSDPFDLNFRASKSPRGAHEFRRGSPNPNWILYEGT